MLASSKISVSRPSPFNTTVFSSKSAASTALSLIFSITFTFIPSFFLFSNILATLRPIAPIPSITIDLPIKPFLSKISIVRLKSFLSLKIYMLSLGCNSSSGFGTKRLLSLLIPTTIAFSVEKSSDN